MIHGIDRNFVYISGVDTAFSARWGPIMSIMLEGSGGMLPRKFFISASEIFVILDMTRKTV